MSRRINGDVSRPDPIDIYVNGEAVTAYPGESIATVLLASGRLVASLDSNGRPRAPFCNMGVCFECIVALERPESAVVERVRACLAVVTPGMRISITGAEPSAR